MPFFAFPIAALVLVWAGLGPDAGPPELGGASDAVCTCVSGAHELPIEEQVRLAVDEASAVFAGRIMAMRFIPDEERLAGIPFDLIEYEVEVVQRWKGGVGDTAYVRTANGSSLCGVELPLGGWALVYARSPEGAPDVLSTSLCDRTRQILLDYPDEEIILLNEVLQRD